MEVKAPTWDAAFILIGNCGLLRDLLDERLDFHRLRAHNHLGIFELDGHAVDVPGRVHELRQATS